MLTFLDPSFLPYLLLGVPVAVLYVWFKRRRRYRIAYLAIWQQVAKQQTPAWKQWLRRILSLLLAMLIVAVMILTAARPRWLPPQPPTPPDRHLLVVFDTSPSVTAPSLQPINPAPPEPQTTLATPTRTPPRWPLRDAVQAVAASALSMRPGDSCTLVWQGATRWHEVTSRPDDFQWSRWPQAATTHRELPVALAALQTNVVNALQRLLHADIDPADLRIVVVTDGQPDVPAAVRRAVVDLLPAHTAEQFQIASACAADRRVHGNLALTDIHVWPTFPALPESLRLTVQATGEALAADAETPTLQFETLAGDALGEPVLVNLDTAGLAQMSLPLPPTPAESVEPVGRDLWGVRLVLRAPEQVRNDRSGDDTIALALPVLRPTPLAVITRAEPDPLLRVLVQTLIEAGVCRFVRPEYRDEAGRPPVLLILGTPPTPLPPARGVLHFQGAAADDADAPVVAWGESPPGMTLDGLSELPPSVRRVRRLSPVADGRALLVDAQDRPLAQWTPAADQLPARIEFGFALNSSDCDLLWRPRLGPVLFRRLLRVLDVQERSPLPAGWPMGQPLPCAPGLLTRSLTDASVMAFGSEDAWQDLPLPRPLPTNADWLLTIPATATPGPLTLRVSASPETEPATYPTFLWRDQPAESAVPAEPPAELPTPEGLWGARPPVPPPPRELPLTLFMLVAALLLLTLEIIAYRHGWTE